MKKKMEEMEQLSLNHTTRLFEKISCVEQLGQAFKLVKANRGSAGIDGVNVEMFEQHLDEELSRLSKELKDWKYKPQPVKRIEIPKPGNKTEKRKLGIPCVRDRVVQTSIKLSIEPIFEQDFSDSSYGFRPKRSQKQAITKAKEYVESGKQWVVDIDLDKFFDRINQDKLMYLLGQKIEDKRVLKLIGMTLHSGVIHKDNFTPALEGSPQGSPLSPLLSNIVLDELDQELERRGLKFCRFADDANIFVGSQKAAERVLKSITDFIERRLKLKVNSSKSKAVLASATKFLGFTIIGGMIVISAASMKRAHTQVRELIPRNTHIPIEQQIERVNQWYRGWSNYHKVTETPSQLETVEARIRRRFRAQLVSNHRAKRFLVRRLIALGVRKSLAYGCVYKNRKAWALSRTLAAHRAWSNQWFQRQHLYSAVTQPLPHWQPLNVWMKLT